MSLDAKALKVELQRLTRETESGAMSMRDAAAELVGWLGKNYTPKKRKRRGPWPAVSLGELRALSKLKQAKIELPLRELVAKERARRKSSTPQTVGTVTRQR